MRGQDQGLGPGLLDKVRTRVNIRVKDKHSSVST